jgi:hydroxyacylglutathione hydrolase
MIFRRCYEPKLAQASYLIGCSATGEALVIDPNRDIQRYIQAAREDGLRIAHVTETHIHADFVSGARELAHRTGARLYLSGAGGPEWQYQYAPEAAATLLGEGSEIVFGQVRIQVLHLPGHTPEHLGFLVADTSRAAEPVALLSGDCLFVGDVGRPDLLERAAGVSGTMKESARELFRSLQRLRKLPDYLQLWPGHGAGSACGKALSAMPQSTLGFEKRFNWGFGISEEDSFVKAVLEGQPDPPTYFAQMKRINRMGPRLLGDGQRPPRLKADELSGVLSGQAMVVDTREAREFARRSLTGTINIPVNRSFTTWAGWLLPYDRDFYLIVDQRRPGVADELIRDLSGIGLDRVAGIFGSEAVEESYNGDGRLQAIASVTLADLTRKLASREAVVLDVRSEAEWCSGHIPGSVNLPLGELDGRTGELPHERPIVVHCHSGGRAAIAASLLRARGFQHVSQFPGGFGEWSASGHAVERSGDSATLS